MRTTTLTWDAQSGWSIDPASVQTAPGRTLVLAFCDPDCQPPLDQLRTSLGSVEVVAVSTAGQILGRDISDQPVVAAIIVFAHATVHTVGMRCEQPCDQVGERLGAQLLEATDQQLPAGVLVFGDGVTVNGQALVTGLQRALNATVPLAGGLAGDRDQFQNAWVYANGLVGSRIVAAVAVVGDRVRFHQGTQGGWAGFGPRRTITRSDGNLLYEVDGQPALPLYKQYLGERAAELPESAMLFPFGVSENVDDPVLVRTVLAVDEDAQSLTFAGEVPQGWSGRLMWTTKDDLIDAAEEAAATVADDSAALALAVSCVGRRLVLGERTEEELDGIVDVLGEQVPLVGFYSYGQIAPINGVYALHNQTMTITTISEDGND